jgi:uncharacterized damage-inducible protein DinB
VDRDALRELFDYTTFTWASYGNSVRALAPGDFTRPVEGSEWPALSVALCHLAFAWDGWLYERFGIDEKPRNVDDAWRDSKDVRIAAAMAVSSWEELQRHRERLRGLLWRAIDETPDDVLDTPKPLEPGGRPRRPRELLTHILLHELRHHGDVSTLLTALGAEPPITDYLVYAFLRDRKKSAATG